ICYQYLTFFMEDDEQLRKIAEEYTTGRMMSSDLKKITGEIIAKEITQHQAALATITDDLVNQYFNWDRDLDIGGCYDRTNDITSQYTDYDNYGINFDCTFGFKCKDVSQ